MKNDHFESLRHFSAHFLELKLFFYLKVSIKVLQKSRLLLFYQIENGNILIEIYETHPGGILRVFLGNGLFSPVYSYRSYSYKKKRVFISAFCIIKNQ